MLSGEDYFLEQKWPDMLHFNSKGRDSCLLLKRRRGNRLYWTLSKLGFLWAKHSAAIVGLTWK